MTVEQLQEKMDGVYDFNDITDCQSVIGMLLRDIELSHLREEQTAHDLKTLAGAVKNDFSKADELAEAALASKRKSPVQVFNFLRQMASEVNRSEKLSDVELTDEVLTLVWGGLDMDGRPSAVLEEMINRFKKHTGQS